MNGRLRMKTRKTRRRIVEIDAMRHVMHDVVGIERRYYVSGGFIGSWHRKLM